MNFAGISKCQHTIGNVLSDDAACSDNCITADADGYNFYNAYGTALEDSYMYAEDGSVKVGHNILDISMITWELEDVFSIQAEFTDNAEFVFYNLASDKCLQYNSVYSANMSLSVADYNPVIDEIVAASGYYGGYIARALSVCQRFKFEPVYDADGDLLYFYILPYLKVNANDIKGAYRSDYRLAVDENGNLGTPCRCGDLRRDRRPCGLCGLHHLLSELRGLFRVPALGAGEVLNP